MSIRELPGSRVRAGRIILLIAIVLVLLAARTIASYVIEFQWWQEMGQISTWLDIMLYSVGPVIGAGIAFFVLLWIAHARAMKAAGTRLSAHPLYAKLSALVLLGISAFLASAVIDSWTVVRYFGGRSLASSAGAWTDPVFNRPLAFYFFDLPFYSLVLRLVLVAAVVTAILYWLVTRFWQLRDRFGEMPAGGAMFDLSDLGLSTALESPFVRNVATIFCLGLAVHFFLDRYDLLFNDHGFLVGADYVNENFTVPLLYLTALAAVAAAVFIQLRRFRLALAMALALVIQFIVPQVVGLLYVRPNEISLQKPYIERHIRATRAAFGFSGRTTEVDFPFLENATIDPARHKALLDNVRLWDWRAFHDTVTQIQSLRTYYVFADTDVDRYTLDGQLRQVLLTPREIDVNQLGNQGSTQWINSHFIYTHGYGLVMASANRITPDGMPVLYIQDTPPVINTPGLRLTRPELYYSEIAPEPVFVHTSQPEFNYPSGSENVHTRYAGKGGFPVSSLPMRFAAALSEGDVNILLTSYLTPESRMMIRRRVRERVQALAGFVSWDPDPYLVLTDAGRLVWMIDGYTTSESHPYSRSIDIENIGSVNYIRNSVKATVDAYDGDVKLYIFDPADPLIQAYAALFPKLFLPKSAMPSDLRRHARYPELLFRTLAEVYRTYHMKDPEAFYNKEDIWDLARSLNGSTGRPEPVVPTYVVATLPGEEQAEFLLMMPFTPRNKDNMVGLMAARCDGGHLGELVILRLSKQERIYGPMQIETIINQDQNISKDLTLWGQQGSQVLRGQMLVLPLDHTFLYVEPIYIQASEARMPQLKKVAIAIGSRLIYTDTYDEALAQLVGYKPPAAQRPALEGAVQGGIESPSPAPSGGVEKRLDSIRDHLRRYQEFCAQGKWVEAGRELEAIEGEVQKR